MYSLFCWFFVEFVKLQSIHINVKFLLEICVAFLMIFLVSETWKDSPDFALYLAELSASSLDKLSKLPA